MILTSDDQVHPDTHVLTMVNNVIEVVNYVIAARPSLLNFMIADTDTGQRSPGETGRPRRAAIPGPLTSATIELGSSERSALRLAYPR